MLTQELNSSKCDLDFNENIIAYKIWNEQNMSSVKIRYFLNEMKRIQIYCIIIVSVIKVFEENGRVNK